MESCSEVVKWSDAFVDGELLAGAQSRVLQHIRHCNDCADLIEEKICLKRLVQARVRNLTAPASLRQSIRAQIGI